MLGRTLGSVLSPYCSFGVIILKSPPIWIQGSAMWLALVNRLLVNVTQAEAWRMLAKCTCPLLMQLELWAAVWVRSVPPTGRWDPWCPHHHTWAQTESTARFVDRLPGTSQCFTKEPTDHRQGAAKGRLDVKASKVETRTWGSCCHKPRKPIHTWSHQKLEEAEKVLPQREGGLANTLF